MLCACVCTRVYVERMAPMTHLILRTVTKTEGIQPDKRTRVDGSHVIW